MLTDCCNEMAQVFFCETKLCVSLRVFVLICVLKGNGETGCMGCGGSVSKQTLDELEAHQLELENERRRLEEKDSQLANVQECLRKHLRGSEQDTEPLNGWGWSGWKWKWMS